MGYIDFIWVWIVCSSGDMFVGKLDKVNYLLMHCVLTGFDIIWCSKSIQHKETIASNTW
jgi:hypothetical protein